MKMFIFSFSLFLSSIATAGDLPVDACEAKLTAGDRYYGAFAAGLSSGRLEAAHLDIAIASESPINPLSDETRTIKNGHLKSLLETYLNDVSVRALWPQT